MYESTRKIKNRGIFIMYANKAEVNMSCSRPMRATVNRILPYACPNCNTYFTASQAKVLKKCFVCNQEIAH